MNFSAAAALMDIKFRNVMKADQPFPVALLDLLDDLNTAMTKTASVSIRERYTKLTKAKTFLVGWRADILLHGSKRGITLGRNFVSANTFQCVLINHVAATLNLLSIAKSNKEGEKPMPCVLGYADSLDAESCFRLLQAMSGK